MSAYNYAEVIGAIEVTSVRGQTTCLSYDIASSSPEFSECIILNMGIPYSTSSFGNPSVRIFCEGEEDLFIGRTFNSLAGQRVIVQEAVVSANNCGYWRETAHCQ